MLKKILTKAAKLANGTDRSCATCPLRTKNGLCHEVNLNVCSKQFIKGFQKGAKWYRQHLWYKNEELLLHKGTTKTPKSNQPLLLRLSNDRLVIGTFEDGKFSFEGDEKVISFIYLKDLL